MKKLDNSCGVILVFRKANQPDLFLLIQENIGHWSFPKGHPELNESKKETATRELFEETGIENVEFLDLPTIVDEYDYMFGVNEYHKTVDYFIAISTDLTVKIKEKEIADYKWATFDEAQNIITYDNSKKIIQKAKEYLDEYDARK